MKTVWITGASDGIGKALCELYASCDWNVILSSRNEQKLNDVKNELKGAGQKFVVSLDLYEHHRIQEVVEQTIDLVKTVDVLICNGGISQRSLALETSLQVEKRVMDIDFFGHTEMTKALLPHFVKNGGGHIAVTSSLVGIIGSPYRSSYAAAKHALHGYYDSLRAELYDQKIGVTMVCPGFIKTNVSVNAVTGTGEQLGKMDDAQANGMSAEKCAKIYKKAIDRKKLEAYIGGKEVMAIYLKRWVPNLFAKILLKAKVR